MVLGVDVWMHGCVDVWIGYMKYILYFMKIKI
jgi:hypothetical protein